MRSIPLQLRNTHEPRTHTRRYQRAFGDGTVLALPDFAPPRMLAALASFSHVFWPALRGHYQRRMPSCPDFIVPSPLPLQY